MAIILSGPHGKYAFRKGDILLDKKPTGAIDGQYTGVVKDVQLDVSGYKTIMLEPISVMLEPSVPGGQKRHSFKAVYIEFVDDKWLYGTKSKQVMIPDEISLKTGDRIFGLSYKRNGDIPILSIVNTLPVINDRAYPESGQLFVEDEVEMGIIPSSYGLPDKV